MTRRTRTIGLVVVALCVLAVGVGVVLSIDRGPRREEASRLPSAIVGTWRPVEIAGYRPPARYPNAFREAPMTFDGRVLHGTDGCNSFDLAYQVARGGHFHVGSGPMTAVGCGNVPNDQVVSAADRIAIAGGTLTLFDAHGNVLGRYRRVTG